MIRKLGLLALGGVVAAAISAPTANADDADAAAFAAQYWPAVCATLDEFPVVEGVEGIVLAIVSEGYLDGHDAGRAIGMSVDYGCPQHWPLLKRFAQKWSPGVMA